VEHADGTVTFKVREGVTSGTAKVIFEAQDTAGNHAIGESRRVTFNVTIVDFIKVRDFSLQMGMDQRTDSQITDVRFECEPDVEYVPENPEEEEAFWAAFDEDFAKAYHVEWSFGDNTTARIYEEEHTVDGEKETWYMLDFGKKLPAGTTEELEVTAKLMFNETVLFTSTGTVTFYPEWPNEIKTDLETTTFLLNLNDPNASATLSAYVATEDAPPLVRWNMDSEGGNPWNSLRVEYVSDGCIKVTPSPDAEPGIIEVIAQTTNFTELVFTIKLVDVDIPETATIDIQDRKLYHGYNTVIKGWVGDADSETEYSMEFSAWAENDEGVLTEVPDAITSFKYHERFSNSMNEMYAEENPDGKMKCFVYDLDMAEVSEVTQYTIKGELFAVIDGAKLKLKDMTPEMSGWDQMTVYPHEATGMKAYVNGVEAGELNEDNMVEVDLLINLNSTNYTAIEALFPTEDPLAYQKKGWEIEQDGNIIQDPLPLDETNGNGLLIVPKNVGTATVKVVTFDTGASFYEATRVIFNITVEEIDYELENVDGGLKLTKYIAADAATATSIEIPAEIHDIPVVELGEAMFKGNTVITSAELPVTVTEIPASLFEGCTALETVTLSDDVTIIGQSAFSGCTKLANMVCK